jgi:RimJ/RimL family protein N-acetyltransferase
MQFHIRAVLSNDIQLVVDFYTSLSENTWFFYHPFPRDVEYLTQLVQKLPERTDTKHFMSSFFQDNKEVMIGTVFFWNWTRKIPWLGIGVSDEYQGQGVGKQMMNFAVDLASRHDKGGILLTTHQQNYRARQLYEQFGFEIIGEDPRGEYLMLLNFEDPTENKENALC